MRPLSEMRQEDARNSLNKLHQATTDYLSINLRRSIMGKLDGTTVAIVVAHEFEDIELLYPIVRLSEEGAKVIVAILPPGTPAHFHTRPHFSDKPTTGPVSYTHLRAHE